MAVVVTAGRRLEGQWDNKDMALAEADVGSMDMQDLVAGQCRNERGWGRDAAV
jgi:hypothetical protein